MSPLRYAGPIVRKHPKLPRHVVIPSELVRRWKLSATTVVTGMLNGTNLGRRTLKPWDSACSRWFVELPEPLCRAAKVDTGSHVTLLLYLADTDLPRELVALLAAEPRAQSAWDALTPNQQRMLRENIAAAKQSATRTRRAQTALFPEATPDSPARKKTAPSP